MSQQPDGMYQIALKERAMQQPKTKHDRSAYEQSVDRLASAMREMLGMGAAQDGNVGTDRSGQPEANQEHAERALASELAVVAAGRWPGHAGLPVLQKMRVVLADRPGAAGSAALVGNPPGAR